MGGAVPTNSAQGPYVSHHPAPVSAEMPAHPITLEGYSVLHQMFRFRWAAWNALGEGERLGVIKDAEQTLRPMEETGLTALFSMVGHKGDLMLIHFRNSFDELNEAELKLAGTRLYGYLEPVNSYLSVIELGLYDSTVKLYKQLMERGVVPHSEEWEKAIQETIERQKSAMSPRLCPKIPDHRYLCFYPMDRKRGEAINFYTVPIESRQKQMEAHGMVGRRYAGKVQQIISGSIGFDDWEWGVDLFGADPLQFKKLIYEMRFDEVSAVYASFGAFFIGLRVKIDGFSEWLGGKLPTL
ncbi:Chlorite dismutase [Candidatus Koribacter versatilis Ellin345]|uniref:Chlorite dismutase n=1 Tax=Koribacter versatilis (strain Ellin345) TaxID=204669 RepID=Q1IQ94_KORVE|nr:Chlorite dismutase [Candidatus Koribacter versatilis Ellin345]